MADGTAREPAQEVVQAIRFELVDRDGRVRAILGSLDDAAADGEAVGLVVLDEAGRHRARFSMEETGPGLTFDLDGNEVVLIGVHDPSPEALHVGGYLQSAIQTARRSSSLSCRGPMADSRSNRYWQSAMAIGLWLEQHQDLLRGLSALRELGPDAADAVQAALDVPEIRQMRLSLGIVEALLEGDGLDPCAYFESIIAVELLQLAHEAIGGSTGQLRSLPGGALSLPSSPH